MRMRPPSRTMGGLGRWGLPRLAGVLLACMLTLTAGAQGQERPKKPEQEKPKKPEEGGKDKDAPYELSLLVIRATKANKDISKELERIAEELKKQFKFTGFKLERKIEAKAETGKEYASDLLADYKVKITPKERKDKRVTLVVEITKRDSKDSKKENRVVRTEVTITEGKYYLQHCGRIDGSEDVLILGVSAR